LGAEISAGTINSRQQALEFLTWTFLYRRIHNNPTYYGIEGLDAVHINQWATQLIDQTLDNLRQSGCVNTFEDGRLAATRYLKISSYYYISHKTIRHFLSALKPRISIKDALLILSKVTEYDELAIRHNEDIVNEELSQELRFHGQDVGLRMVDPHVKAFLLVQAHMTRIDLPIEDYVQDTVAVLDQSLRILQAAVDTAAELGFLSACLSLIQLMQCIKQVCWDDDDPVTCLPGLTIKKSRLQTRRDCVS
jgi:antiviral helicase SLH1